MWVGLFALRSPTHRLARVRRSTRHEHVRQRDPVRRDELRRARGDVHLEEPERARARCAGRGSRAATRRQTRRVIIPKPRSRKPCRTYLCSVSRERSFPTSAW